MKVKINSNKINQLINAEKVNIDQSKVVHDEKSIGKEQTNETSKEQSLSTIPKDTLKAKIGEGKVGEVFRDLNKLHLSEDNKNQLILLNGRFTILKKDKNNHVVNSEDFETRMSRIINAVLELIDDL